MPQNKLTSKSFITAPGGAVIAFSEISKKNKQEIYSKIKKRLTTEMSIYYTQHPDEYIKL